jgi:hypothetical protein
MPHFIILEVYDGTDKRSGKSGIVTNKPPLKWNFTHGYQMLLYYRVK